MLMKYADDSALLKVIRKVADRLGAVEEVDRDLESVVEWGRMWKVAFEPKKTHAMLCTRKKPSLACSSQPWTERRLVSSPT